MSFLSRQKIGEIIHQRRIELEMSQQQVANLVKYHFPGVCCSQFTMSAIESGQQEISARQLGAIATILELSITVFFAPRFEWRIISLDRATGEGAMLFGHYETEEEARMMVNFYNGHTPDREFHASRFSVGFDRLMAEAPLST